MIVTNRMVYLFLSALPGNKLWVSPDGDCDVRPAWSTVEEVSHGRVAIACPGLDPAFIAALTHGFAIANDRGVYAEQATGTLIGHIFEVLHHRIERGDLEPYRHHLAQLIALHRGFKSTAPVGEPHTWSLTHSAQPGETDTLLDALTLREHRRVRSHWITSSFYPPRT